MKLKKNNTLKTSSSQLQIPVNLTKVALLLHVAIYMAMVVSFDVSAAITGKVSGVITAEATNEPLGECHCNNPRNK